MVQASCACGASWSWCIQMLTNPKAPVPNITWQIKDVGEDPDFKLHYSKLKRTTVIFIITIRKKKNTSIRWYWNSLSLCITPTVQKQKSSSWLQKSFLHLYLDPCTETLQGKALSKKRLSQPSLQLKILILCPSPSPFLLMTHPLRSFVPCLSRNHLRGIVT